MRWFFTPLSSPSSEREVEESDIVPNSRGMHLLISQYVVLATTLTGHQVYPLIKVSGVHCEQHVSISLDKLPLTSNLTLSWFKIDAVRMIEVSTEL